MLLIDFRDDYFLISMVTKLFMKTVIFIGTDINWNKHERSKVYNLRNNINHHSPGTT